VVSVWWLDDMGMGLWGDMEKCLSAFKKIKNNVSVQQLYILGFSNES
jgi:hypothetical protein